MRQAPTSAAVLATAEGREKGRDVKRSNCSYTEAKSCAGDKQREGEAEGDRAAGGTCTHAKSC